MKRMIVLFAVLLMAAPAMAAVLIDAVDEGGGVVAISFTNDEATGKVRAIALDITTDSGAIIVDVNDINTEYNIHPGSIEIDYGDPWVSGDGEIVDYGSAVCDSFYPGTKGGIGSTGDEAGVTIEMASLYVGEVNEPNQSGLICRVYVNADCTLTVSENVIRGGIVMEDPMAASDPNTPVSVLVDYGCPCIGNLVNDPPEPSVSANDCFILMNLLTYDAVPPYLEIWPGEPGFTRCASDINPNDKPGFNVVTVDDCFWLMSYLTPSAGAPVACMP